MFRRRLRWIREGSRAGCPLLIAPPVAERQGYLLRNSWPAGFRSGVTHERLHPVASDLAELTSPKVVAIISPLSFREFCVNYRRTFRVRSG